MIRKVRQLFFRFSPFVFFLFNRFNSVGVLIWKTRNSFVCFSLAATYRLNNELFTSYCAIAADAAVFITTIHSPFCVFALETVQPKSTFGVKLARIGWLANSCAQAYILSMKYSENSIYNTCCFLVEYISEICICFPARGTQRQCLGNIYQSPTTRTCLNFDG